MKNHATVPGLTPHTLAATTLELEGLEFVVFELPSRAVFRSDFTASENAIVVLVANGYTTGRIAAARDVSYRTVANQLASIYQKTSLSSRAELLSLLRSGLPSE